MLEHEQRPLRNERFSSARDVQALVQPRVLVGLLLVLAGGVWALFRGLHFYGLSPVHLAYDLDQPPWLLVLVSGWLLYRSRR
jgi:hypothetical protein